MACDFSGEVKIEFPTSGIEIVGYEADIRRQKHQHAYADFEISRAAAELVSGSVPDYSTAIVYIEEERAYRMVYNREHLSLTRDLEGNRIGELELLDATKVMANGTITANKQSVTLRGVVEYILDQVNDPDDVITDHVFETGVDTDDLRIANEERFFLPQVISTVAGDNPLSEILADMESGLYDAVNGVLGTSYLEEEVHDGFEWEKTSPLVAFHEVMQEYELDYWVDVDGTLHIGQRVGIDTLVGVVDNEGIVMQNYGITTTPDEIRGVHLEGSFREVRPYRPEMAIVDGLTNEPDIARLVQIAEVIDPTSNGYMAAGEYRRDFEGLDTLENVAARQLIREKMRNTSGSIEINGLASEDSGIVARLDVGEVLYFGENLKEECNIAEFQTGLFVIHSIQHKANEREGWIATIELSRVPNLNELEFKSVLYDPFLNEEFDSYEEWAEEDIETNRPSSEDLFAEQILGETNE